jgi:hypothetical protein
VDELLPHNEPKLNRLGAAGNHEKDKEALPVAVCNFHFGIGRNESLVKNVDNGHNHEIHENQHVEHFWGDFLPPLGTFLPANENQNGDTNSCDNI